MPIKRLRRGPAPRLIERLDTYWERVHRGGADDCWPWLGSVATRGYGLMWSGETRGKTKVMVIATHVALLMDGRPRPTRDHVAMHRCDNPRCVNPAHLSWGTNADNHADAVAKGRVLKHFDGRPCRALRFTAGKIPPRLVCKTNKEGVTSWYWQPSASLRKQGWLPHALGPGGKPGSPPRRVARTAEYLNGRVATRTQQTLPKSDLEG